MKELILAIESSCDETSVAVVSSEDEILSNVIASQIKSHRRFGGVVPEVASRHHVEQITLCINEALSEANVKPSELKAVAVTFGPGLVGSLLIGLSAAKAFAWAHGLPLIPVNHMAGHIYAAKFVQPLEFPLMALLVSGGHTELVYMQADGEFEIIGETRDDAAGEAYDKVARALGLGYPGGPKIDKLAKEGNPKAIVFPKANFHEETLDFSFSGVKSAVLNYLNKCKMQNIEVNKADVAASFQYAVIDVLKENVLMTCKKKNVKTIAIAGGVASNSSLRETLIKEASKRGIEVLFPAPILCTDNAAMIGSAAYFNFVNGKISDLNLNAKPNLKLNS